MNELATFSTEDLLQELIRRRRTYIAQLDKVLAAWGADVSLVTKAAHGSVGRTKTANRAKTTGVSRSGQMLASRTARAQARGPARRALRAPIGKGRRREASKTQDGHGGAQQAKPLPPAPRTWASAAVTDPELLLAAFDIAEPPQSGLRSRPSDAPPAPPASAPSALAGAPTAEAGPALRENEIAVRTPGGGVVIRRRRVQVEAS